MEAGRESHESHGAQICLQPFQATVVPPVLQQTCLQSSPLLLEKKGKGKGGKRERMCLEGSLVTDPCISFKEDESAVQTWHENRVKERLYQLGP